MAFSAQLCSPHDQFNRTMIACFLIVRKIPVAYNHGIPYCSLLRGVWVQPVNDFFGRRGRNNELTLRGNVASCLIGSLLLERLSPKNVIDTDGPGE